MVFRGEDQESRANHVLHLMLGVDLLWDYRSAALMRPFPAECGWYSANMDRVGCGKGRCVHGWRYRCVAAITVTWTLEELASAAVVLCCSCCHSAVQSTAELGHPLGCDVMRGIFQQPRFTTQQDLSNSFPLLPSSIQSFLFHPSNFFLSNQKKSITMANPKVYFDITKDGGKFF